MHTRTNNLIPYQYTGKYRESISGFNHMDARWYNPKVGRFIQPDQYNHVNLMLPKGAQSELMRYIGRTQSDLLKDPSQQMRYGYVSGNALRWVDPLGLCEPKDIEIPPEEKGFFESVIDTVVNYVMTEVEGELTVEAGYGIGVSGALSASPEQVLNQDQVSVSAGVGEVIGASAGAIVNLVNWDIGEGLASDSPVSTSTTVQGGIGLIGASVTVNTLSNGSIAQVQIGLGSALGLSIGNTINIDSELDF
ncbi:RHS repeat-associated core domain-containing protein [Reinekea forsetii]|nr:RHS repeat-associated core domain-containing protein [Reinekea forsetii]